MTARRRVLPNFGQFLVTLRERSKRWGTPAFAKHAKLLGLQHVSENKLKQHESGITSDVRAEFLRDLSALYQTPYPVLLRALIVEKYGYDIAIGVEVQNGDVKQVIGSIETPLGKTPTVPAQPTDTSDAASVRARRTSDPGTEVGRVSDTNLVGLEKAYQHFAHRLTDSQREALAQEMETAGQLFLDRLRGGEERKVSGK